MAQWPRPVEENEVMTDPKDLPYTIAGRDMVMERDGLRVQVLTLALLAVFPDIVTWLPAKIYGS